MDESNDYLRGADGERRRVGVNGWPFIHLCKWSHENIVCVCV